MRLSIAILMMAATFFVLAAALYFLRSYPKKKSLRPTVTRDLPRSPGQRLLAELDRINKDFRRYCTFAVLSPLTVLAVHLMQSYLGAAEESIARLMVSGCGGVIFCGFAIGKAIKLLHERRTIQLGYEDELAAGRELEQLDHDGFYVYHGFAAETFTIDHIVVGPKGVFAVETKTHARSASKNRVEDATVRYDGRMLYFPRAEDFETIDRARQQADWLSDWLGNAIGEPIAARAIVALPGWVVKRTSADGIPVVNPQQFSSLFKHIKPRPLSDAAILRINHQLDQKCRGPIFR